MDSHLITPPVTLSRENKREKKKRKEKKKASLSCHGLAAAMRCTVHAF